MNSRKRLALVAIATSALFVSTTPAIAGTTLNGSGATFAAPLIDACRVDYERETGNQVNYAGGGSGKGRNDFKAGLVPFAGSDAPYSPRSTEPANLIYAPIYAAPIAIMYNLPTVKESIYLSPATLAKIFGGAISNWNHPDIAKDNERTVKTPIFATKQVKITSINKKTKKKTTTTRTVPDLDSNGQAKIASYSTTTVNIDLPNQPITVWYRSESSGTSENFAGFLKGANERSNPDLWPKNKNGTFANTTPKSLVNFFNFQGASGSAAVTAGVAKTVGGISYSELSFATDAKLGVANILNAAGEWIAPSSAATTLFVGGGTIGNDGVVTYDYEKKITGAYPLGVVSYGLAGSSGTDSSIQESVAQWFTFVLDKCATKYPEKGFAQISGPLYDKAKERISKIK
jgi:phosphate transport system substrate-binding protein